VNICPIEQQPLNLSKNSNAVLVVVVTAGGAATLDDDFYRVSQAHTLNFELDFAIIRNKQYVLTPYVLNDDSYLFRLESCLFTRSTGIHFFCYLHDLPVGFLGKIKTANTNTFLVQLLLEQRHVRPIQFKVSTFGDQIKFRLLPDKEAYCMMYKCESSLLNLSFPISYFAQGVFIDLLQVSYIDMFYPSGVAIKNIAHVDELLVCFKNMFVYFDKELFKQDILYESISSFEVFYNSIHEKTYQLMLDSGKSGLVLEYLLAHFPHSFSCISFVIYTLNTGFISILPTQYYHPLRHIFKLNNTRLQLLHLLDVSQEITRLAYFNTEYNFVSLSTIYSAYFAVQVGMSCYDDVGLLQRVCRAAYKVLKGLRLSQRFLGRYQSDLVSICILVCLHLLRMNCLKSLTLSHNQIVFSASEYGAIPSERSTMFYRIRDYIKKNFLSDISSVVESSLHKDIVLMLLIVERLVNKRCRSEYKAKVNIFFNQHYAYLRDSSRAYTVSHVEKLLAMNESCIDNVSLWQKKVTSLKQEGVPTTRSAKRRCAAVELGEFKPF
jgi:hypothetical protein